MSGPASMGEPYAPTERDHARRVRAWFGRLIDIERRHERGTGGGYEVYKSERETLEAEIVDALLPASDEPEVLDSEQRNIRLYWSAFLEGAADRWSDATTDAERAAAFNALYSLAAEIGAALDAKVKPRAAAPKADLCVAALEAANSVPRHPHDIIRDSTLDNIVEAVLRVAATHRERFAAAERLP